MAPTSILSLPTEMIDAIIGQIDSSLDETNFSRACKLFADRVSKKLLSHVAVEFEDAGPTITMPLNIYQIRMPPLTSRMRCVDVDGCSCEPDQATRRPSQIPLCGELRCRACTLAGTLGGLDHYLSLNSQKISISCRSLTFRGQFGKRSIVGISEPGDLEHDFVGTRGLVTMHPQCFEFNMCWKYWDFMILRILCLPQLVTLKVPLGTASDIVSLGKALGWMSSLQSLTVTDMPDNPDYLNLLPILGLGILSRSGTLRELGLFLTNFNRPDQYCETWERNEMANEAFVKPNSYDHFFEYIFPSSPDNVSEPLLQEYTTFKNAISISPSCSRKRTLPLLKLRKLCLKRIDLPFDAFTRVFDPTRLEEFHLRYCDIDRTVWACLRDSKLVALESVDYELLPSICQLLGTKTSLESLSFDRPPDIYEDGDIIWWSQDEAPTHVLQARSQPPPLGQSTEWCRRSCYSQSKSVDFPSLEVLMEKLTRTRVRSFLLPADMYDITPEFFCHLGFQLPFLQHLTCGFDYSNQDLRKAFAGFFLPRAKFLRKITFLSLHLPRGWNNIESSHLAFDAPSFHHFIKALGAKVPSTLRYIRYQHLVPKLSPGERPKMTVYYHRQGSNDGQWWIRLDAEDAERCFEEERTPQIVSNDIV